MKIGRFNLGKHLRKISFILVFALIISGIFTYTKDIFVSGSTILTDDASVNTKASFSTDVIYQIVTDRFFDGNTSNNPAGAIFDKSNLRKYHGGDWAGIISKLNDGYFTNMGVTAL